jgi:hypothetical protein
MIGADTPYLPHLGWKYIRFIGDEQAQFGRAL